MAPDHNTLPEPVKVTWSRLAVLGLVAMVAVVGATVLRTRMLEPQGNSNWAMAFHDVSGWKKEPPGPNTLFRYVHPTDNVYIRGSEHQDFSTSNPTPEDTTDSMAEDAVSNTFAKQPGWNAQRLPDVMAGSDRFSVVYREGPDRKTLSAFLAKGNSTFMVAMASGKGGDSGFERERKTFLHFLQDLRLRPMTQDEFIRCRDRRSTPDFPRL